MPELFRAHLVHLTGRPSMATAEDSLVDLEDGGLLVGDDGVIVWSGPWAERPRDLCDAPGVRFTDWQGCWLFPGFIDTHVHFPQVWCLDSYGGGQLLEWLERCIFPAEARLDDPDLARAAAADFTARLAAVGTTTSLVYGSAFSVAQNAVFEAFHERGLRGVIGRSIQTVGDGAAAPLVTGEHEAIRLCREEIERWHPLDPSDRAHALVHVALIPRFSLSVTTETLRALGELYDEYREHGVYFSSHLSENNRDGDGEVALVRERFQVPDYLDTYDGCFLPGGARGGSTLLGPRSILAHGVWCTPRELARLAETGSSISHCPVSQQFLGSGRLPWKETHAAGVNVALGSDIGAGDRWFLPEVLNCAYKVHLNAGTNGIALEPAQLLHLATVAGARALDQEDRIGNLDPGREADLVCLDPARVPQLARRLANVPSAQGSAWRSRARLFGLLMGAREQAVREVRVRGRTVHVSASTE